MAQSAIIDRLSWRYGRSLTALTHSLTHSPTHPLTHSPTHPLIHSPTQDHLQDLQGHLQDLQEHLQDLFQGGFKRIDGSKRTQTQLNINPKKSQKSTFFRLLSSLGQYWDLPSIRPWGSIKSPVGLGSHVRQVPMAALQVSTGSRAALRATSQVTCGS